MTLANEVAPDKLWLPTLNKEITRPWFLPDKGSLDEQARLLANFYFLIKQGDTFGERLRCTRCNRRHDYITLMCVERPYSGLTRGLYAYYQYVKDSGIYNSLNAEQQARVNGIKEVLGNTPDIGTSHPQLVRKLAQGMGVSDIAMGGLALGILEGIAPTHAHKLVQKINDRGLRLKLVLEQPLGTDTQRALEYARR